MIDFNVGNIIAMLIITVMIMGGVFVLVAKLLSDFYVNKEEKDDE